MEVAGNLIQKIIDKMIKNKKTTGILAILVIILISSGILYLKSGFKELKKNDTESVFVEDDINNDKSDQNLINNSSKSQGKKSSEQNTKTEDVSLKDKFIVVEIKGEVKKPDVYTLNEDSIVKDLIDKAGGITENADLSKINRAKKLQNHEEVYIANVNETTPNSPNTNIAVNSNKTQASSSEMININSATIEDLKKLNGVGDAKAKSIIEYREQNGGFKSIEDLKSVKGFGGKMFEKIKDQIEV